MDTRDLLQQAKERFAHNASKAYLKEKYDAKLMIAEQGGFWKADLPLISALHSFDVTHLVCIDMFEKPIKVERQKLLEALQQKYQSVMEEYHTEWQKIENKR